MLLRYKEVSLAFVLYFCIHIFFSFLARVSIIPIKVLQYTSYHPCSCVPGPLCNSLVELTITKTFDPSTVLKKKNLRFYTRV